MGMYNPSNDNAKSNASYQGILKALSEKGAMKVAYPSIDILYNATLTDNFIYLSTTDIQHACYKEGSVARQDCYSGMTGYFTSKETVLHWINPDGTFDAYGFHRSLCVAPTPYATNPPAPEVMDKRHLDRFYVDRDRMELIYGTKDFNAAIGKCNANNQYGPDGGDQGYNASLTELYNNGCLKYAGTYDADPSSTIKCRKELDLMEWARSQKCAAILSGLSLEEVQNIGYALNDRCHEKTAFNSSYIENLQEKYKNYIPTYNSKVAEATTNSDRLYNSSDRNNKSTKFSPLQLVLFAGTLIWLFLMYWIAAPSGLLQHMLWFVSAAIPFVPVVLLLRIFPSLRNKKGGILLLALFAILLLLIQKLYFWLSIAYLVVGTISLFKGISNILPDTYTVTLENADGTTTTETHILGDNPEQDIKTIDSGYTSQGYTKK